MKNVLIKNKLFLVCIIIMLFSCKKNKITDNNLLIKQVVEKPPIKKRKQKLLYDVDFSEIGFGRIIKPIDTTGLNDENQLINIHLIFPSEFKKKYTITKKKVARTMPFEFRLQEEDNGNISFLITQFYHPYDDSLVFIKTKNGLQFKEFYNNAYSSSNYRNYIKKGEFKQKGNHIELYNNINYP